LTTSHKNTFFTIVNNGSSNEVIDYLNSLYQQNKIHELIHSTNIGKLNSIIKGYSGHQFKLITITDADVLFLNNWQKSTYDVFNNFPKTGMVCPTPSSKSYNDKSFNILFENLFSKRMRFTKVKNPEALIAFATSIGNPEFYKKQHLEKYLTISNNNFKAVIGAGHFVGTYRYDVFQDLGIIYSQFSLGGDSEYKILDKPIIKNGLWRMSTEDNFAYHLGNVVEPWMQETINNLKQSNTQIETVTIDFKKRKQNYLIFWIKNHLFQKILYRKFFRQLFLNYKGLTKKEALEY